MVQGREFLKANISNLLPLISATGESAVISIDLITRAVRDAKSNAKLFVGADGFHYLALLLTRPNAAPDISTELLLAQVKAAGLVARVCEISQWYLNAALEAGILGALLTRCWSEEGMVRGAALSALVACIDMLEEIAQVAPKELDWSTAHCAQSTRSQQINSHDGVNTYGPLASSLSRSSSSLTW